MLADLDSHTQDSSTQVRKNLFIFILNLPFRTVKLWPHAPQLYDNVPYNKYLSGDHYKPAHQSSASPQGRPSIGYPPHPQGQYHPVPSYPSEPQSPQYPTSHQQDYYTSSSPKPYPQPVPASYTTASTPTGPRFSVQVKTAQPVTYSQTGRQAEQAYTPPPPRQHTPRPPPQSQTGPQGWYPSHQVQEMHSEAGFKGSSPSSGGRVNSGPMSKRGMENSQPAQGPVYQSSKVDIHFNVWFSVHLRHKTPYFVLKELNLVIPPVFQQGTVSSRPEEELEWLTKKLVYDMNHPPSEDYFGTVFSHHMMMVLTLHPCINWDLQFPSFYLHQAAVLAVATMLSVMEAVALPWSRCSTWSVSPASPAMPAFEGSPSTPSTRRVTVRAVTL